MSIPTILRGYTGGLLSQKDDGLRQLDNTNTIHAFNWLEEKGHVDLARDALYALGIPTIQD